jgi:hypothetical protein
MNKLYAWSVMFLLTMSSARSATVPEADIPLFNGKDLDGWVFYLEDHAAPETVWSVRDGLLRCEGSPPGYMRTSTSYANYKLTVEWRFVEPGNTGLLLHIQGKDKVWPKSVEFQGKHQDQGDVFVIGGVTCAEQIKKTKRRIPKKGDHHEKPLGEWNLYEVICRGDVLEGYVNGKLMNRLTDCSVSEGWVALQSEGAVWELRSAVLSPLPDAAP